MFSRRGRSVDDFFFVISPRTVSAGSSHVRDSERAHQAVYRRNVEAMSGERRKSVAERGGGGLGNGLEGDDNMSDAGHGVRGLPVDGEIVVLPEDIGFIWLGVGIEGLGV
jgi:hypothetical protein